MECIRCKDETDKTICFDCVDWLKELYTEDLNFAYIYREFWIFPLKEMFVVEVPYGDYLKKTVFLTLEEAKSAIDVHQNVTVLANQKIHQKWHDEGISEEFAEWMMWPNPHPFTKEFCANLVSEAEKYLTGEKQWELIKIDFIDTV